MKTKNSSRGNMTYRARIIAFFLVAGGLLGILTLVMMHFHLARQHQSLPVISSLISVALFAWGILTGVDLWQAKPRGFKWARILFALQVPVFSIHRLVYEFSTLFSFRVMIGNTTRHTGGDIGSSSSVYLTPHPLGLMFGINIVAVISLLYLIRATRSASPEVPGGSPARAVEYATSQLHVEMNRLAAQAQHRN